MDRDVFRQFIEMVLQHLNDEDCLAIADELRKRSLLRQHVRLLRAYRQSWYHELSDRAAARQIEQDLARAAASPLSVRVMPSISDPKQAEAFEILTSGPRLGFERLRQILRG
ncbi:hypothetical protein RX327_20015 [Bradyrhizobium sp. BEA-2-5]|uniref:hypothetical protein n=1 Tax=Bradyrhizobium sp. BEA-2-5 TaxID=3080015 RepID=UPI00293E5056|nr:hypothetical protein [Bradyrhizobium sp. BEA-2-5]WOH78256.1 hypothetical protein RX327_20015 [Bradyrhizobium sp. BEA-2-5]